VVESLNRSDPVSNVGVLDKVMIVMRAVEARGPLALADLHDATGIPRATAHRLAAALEQHGLLRRDPFGRFALGLGLIGLGRAASESFPLAELARPWLDVLRDETGEGVQLYVREGDSRRCVVSLQSPHGLRWIVPEGVVLPLGIGSAGRILASDGGAPTRSTWVESIEEREPGVASVSAPILGPDGEVVAAVSVSGPLERMTRQPGKRFGTAVVRAASGIATAITL
jgi:DNA-binding IclR family transcriptional regulator